MSHVQQERASALVQLERATRIEARALAMLRAAERELDALFTAIAEGGRWSLERFHRCEQSYLEARAIHDEACHAKKVAERRLSVTRAPSISPPGSA